MMKTRVGAVIFFGLLGLLWFIIPIVTKLFDKEYRAKLKQEIEEEEKKKTKEQKEKEEKRGQIRWFVFFFLGILIYTLFFK